MHAAARACCLLTGGARGVEVSDRPRAGWSGAPIDQGGSGLDGVTQFVGSSTVLFVGQDGAPMDDLRSFEFTNRGELIGAYTNGNFMVLDVVGLAVFPRPMGLLPLCDGLLLETETSGPPLLGTPATARFGALVSGALEVQVDVPHCE